MSILLLGCRWNSVGHAPGSGYFGPTGFDLVSANGFPPFPCRHAPATIGNLQSHRQRDCLSGPGTNAAAHSYGTNGRRHPALYAPSTNFRRRTLGLPRAAAAVVMGARSSAVGRIVFGAAARQGHNVVGVGGFAAAAIAPIIVALQDGQTELAPAPRVIAAAGCSA